VVGRTPLEKARALDTTATIIISCRRRRSLYVASSLVVVVARLRHVSGVLQTAGFPVHGAYKILISLN
jgi:hypothetical protein